MIRVVSRRNTRVAAVAALAIGSVVLSAPQAGAQARTAAHRDFTVVARGLDNPRGLSVLPSGNLVVGEAGHAGTDACFPGGPEGTLCIGFTSQISVIDVATGRHRPIVKGLVSGGDGPIGTTGVDGVSTVGGRVFGILTGSPQGAPPAAACAGDAGCLATRARAKAQVGKLIQAKWDGSWTSIADVGRFNYRYIVRNKARLDPDNPDFTPGDSNPYGVDATAKGAYVVDGGSNTLDWVSSSGDITVLAYLPNPPGLPTERFPYDAVPTCVVATDRAVYVADLAGRLWTWTKRAGLRQVALPDGRLHATNGCAADAHGNVYVVDMFAGFDPDFGFAPMTGSVVKVTPSGRSWVVARGLNLPGGIAVDGDDVYVSNNAVCPADVTGLPPQLCPSSGQVVRLS